LPNLSRAAWVVQDGPELPINQHSKDALQKPCAPAPAAHPQQKKGPNDLARRLSKDGFEDWVDKRQLRQSRVPQLLRKRADRPGRRWDHLRTAEPVIIGTGYRPPGSDPYAQWRDMIHSTWYGRLPGEESEIVSDEYLHQLQPGLDNEVKAPYHPRDPKPVLASRKQRFMSRFWDFMLRHPITPLIFRLLVLSTTIAALAVSVNIYNSANSARIVGGSENRSLIEAEFSQSIVAIAVDAIAIPYIMYMLWDEYTGKPLGLRPPVQKISLTLLDLFFIIFKAASTALAFQVLVSKVISATDDSQVLSYHLARSLAALMLVGLIAWVVNFTISVFRLVERLGGVDDG
jgi:hypothetical protein